MSTINVTCADQVLTFTNMPVVASGDINADKIAFDFSSEWKDCAKICVFYVQKGKYHYAIINGSGEAVIPSEVMQRKAILRFGVIGFKNGVQRTSNVLAFRIHEGAYSTVDWESDAYKNSFSAMLSALAQKLDADQGSANVGKYLRINSIGQVYAAAIPAGSAYRIDNAEYGIKSDGSDPAATTSGLQSALNYAAASGCRNVYLDAGTYAIKCSNQIQVYSGKAYYGIKIPSGIHLYLDPGTVLKAQANGLTGYAMIYFCDATDAGIYGGKLYGDRDSHDYSANGTHESGHVIAIRISSYITVKNVQIYQPTGDGITVGGLYAHGESGYVRPNHIVVDGCIIDGARRNDISLIDGEYVQIINNTIQNAGTVNGTNPKAGMDIEPNYASTNENWQRAENIFIKNNTFANNSANDLILHGGRTTAVVVENNIFECSALTGSSVLSHCNKDVKICGNIFSASSSGKNAIQTDAIPNTHDDRQNQITVSSNQIVNMSIWLNGDEITVSSNIIASGDILAQKLRNATILNNTITAGRIRIVEAIEDSTTFTKNIVVSGNRINDYNPTNASGAIVTSSSSGGNGLFGITIKNNMIVDCKIGVSAKANSGNVIIDSNAIYSTVDPDDENYKSIGFAIDVSGYSDVVCTNNIINKTTKIIAYTAESSARNVNISNNIVNAGNATQAIKLTGIKTDDTITPFSVRFANNVIKSLSTQNTFMALINLSGCRVLNNEIDSQSTYRPISSLNSINTVYVNNLTSGAFAKADSDTESGTVTI